MKNKDFLKFFKNKIEDMGIICEKKNKDYANEDSFSNFKMNEILGVCSVEQAIFSRMLDKITRIANIMKKGNNEVKDETIQDTLMDLANYSIILSIYLENNDR